MAHYAFIKDNIVTEVIVGKDETETAPEGFADWEEYYLTKRPDQDTCKRTSYNTVANEHLENGISFRGNFAGIGMSYDTENDVFIPIKKFESHILNENTWTWEPPIPKPDDGINYIWDETTWSWVASEF